MFRVAIHRRAVAVTSLAVHLFAGLLAASSHDHGGCCGGRTPAPVAEAREADAASPGRSVRKRSCLHTHCCHADGDHKARGESVRPRSGGWRAAPAGHAAATPRCLACDFLAGAIAVLEWTPSGGCMAVRWRDPVTVRPAVRSAAAGAFLARGPPA